MVVIRGSKYKGGEGMDDFLEGWWDLHVKWKWWDLFLENEKIMEMGGGNPVLGSQGGCFILIILYKDK